MISSLLHQTLRLSGCHPYTLFEMVRVLFPITARHSMTQVSVHFYQSLQANIGIVPYRSPRHLLSAFFPLQHSQSFSHSMPSYLAAILSFSNSTISHHEQYMCRVFVILKQIGARESINRSLTRSIEREYTEIGIRSQTPVTNICKKGTGKNQLTPWGWALLQKPSVVQLLKNFPTFYGTRRFNAVFTRALHWSLSWTRSIQSIPPHPTSLRSILTYPLTCGIVDTWSDSHVANFHNIVTCMGYVTNNCGFRIRWIDLLNTHRS
jgi:hypothetical protein